MRVRQHLVADRRVEGATLRIDDSRIDIHRGLLSASCVVNAVRSRKRVDILVVQTEIALELAQLRGIGNPSERILAGDLRQLECRINQLLHARRRQVAGVGAGGALSKEDAHANALRA